MRVLAFAIGMTLANGVAALDLAGYAIGEEFTMSHRADFTRRQGNICTERACVGQTTLGDFDATVTVMFDDDSRVWFVNVTFPYPLSGAAERSAIEKYGKPSASGKSIAQNAFGAKYPVRSLTWRASNAKITFSDRCAAVDTGCLTLVADAPKLSSPPKKFAF